MRCCTTLSTLTHRTHWQCLGGTLEHMLDVPGLLCSSGKLRVRRLSDCVLTVQIANYEYGFFWYFYNDGHIEHEVKLTGCLSTNLLSPGEGPNPTHGTLLHPGLNAQVTIS